MGIRPLVVLMSVLAPFVSYGLTRFDKWSARPSTCSN